MMTQYLQKWALLVLFTCLSVCAQAQGNARYHTVEEGQTVYSIARHYNIPASELIKLNPDAGDLIKPGDKLRLPDSAKAQAEATGPGAQFVRGGAQGSTTTGSTKCKQMYQVQKKDNLYRIAMNFGLSVQEIVDANPGLTTESKVKKGEWLCIPYSKAELQREAERLAAEREAALAASRKASKSHLNVGLILPFKEKTDRGSKMVEFYQGMLMAVDSVRKQGVSVDLYAYHSGNSIADMSSILEKTELQHMDVIFGPLDGVQANVLSNFCQQHKIRLVMPFATTNTYGTSNPYNYVVFAQADEVTRQAAIYAGKQFEKCNYIQINAGSADHRGTVFINSFAQQIATRGNGLRILDVNTDIEVMAALMDASKTNLIVVNSTSQTALQKTTRKMRDFLLVHPEYKISLLGYPEWSTYQGSIVQDFHALDTYTFTTFYRNPNDARTSAFEQRFKANFHHDVIKTLPRYSMMGMDLGYYFLNGLAKLGDFFDERQATLSYNPLQSTYHFGQEGGKAFVNQSVSFLHYTTAGKIEVLKQK